jgi:hypothetical protein
MLDPARNDAAHSADAISAPGSMTTSLISADVSK